MHYLHIIFLLFTFFVATSAEAARSCTKDATRNFTFTATLTASQLRQNINITHRFGTQTRTVWSNNRAATFRVSKSSFSANTDYVIGFRFRNPAAIGSVGVGTLEYHLRPANGRWKQIAKRNQVAFARTVRFNINRGDLNCGGQIVNPPPPPPPSATAITITPDNTFSLLCETPILTYTVLNNNGAVATDYTGSITTRFPSDVIPLTPKVGTKSSNNIYTPRKGILKIPIQTNVIGQYTLQASLTSNGSVADSTQVLFRPYKFSASTDVSGSIKSVAGYPTAFNLQVLACKNDAITPVQGYEGDKRLTVSKVNLVKPAVQHGAKTGALQLSNNEVTGFDSSNVSLNFSSDAKATSYLTYHESGSASFTLADPEFKCPPQFDNCEVVNGDGSTESVATLQGTINIDVRPWAFAICEPNDRDMTGDAHSGSGFVAAGEEFSLQVKPIVWQKGEPLIGEVDVSNYCKARVTENFFIDEAPAANIGLTSQLATPVGGRLFNGLESQDSLQRSHNDVVDKKYLFSKLQWREVGSLKVIANVDSQYLNMEINPSFRHIGRFYPHHLGHLFNSWDYAIGHYDFAYMNQPITMAYAVEARNKQNEATQNYGLFSSELQNQLRLLGVYKPTSEDLISSRVRIGNITDNGWQRTPFGLLTASYYFRDTQFIFKKQRISNSNNNEYTSTPDGPYNLSNMAFGVGVSVSVDGLDFDLDSIPQEEKISLTDDTDQQRTGVAFPLTKTGQPNFLYGRMTLSNIRGPSVEGGKLRVPLKVEYWDGQQYITNVDDRGSQFRSSQYCTQIIKSNKTVTLANLTSPSASITVAKGLSSLLSASQPKVQSETIRLFLRQGGDANQGLFANSVRPIGTNCIWNKNINQPWLQFNWRDFGDEDPSTVVVFGSYRGNDRVIYRGEPNLVRN